MIRRCLRRRKGKFTALDYPGRATSIRIACDARCVRAEMSHEAAMGSFNKRLYYVLLMFLVCTAALTLFLLIWSLDTRSKVSAFAKEGMVTQGVVLDKA